MKRIALLLSGCGFLLCFSGCGPLTAPMAPRLDDEAQRQIDAAWEKALSPVDRLDHHLLLDVFVGTGAYQRGVDKLSFRSEKRYAGGLVVMEVHYDRAAPADDRFEVKVVDPAGKLLREERYGRDEVEQTYRDLYVNAPRPLKEGEPESPEEAEKRAKYQARWAKIEQVFPKPQEETK
jgi:hypothetical protein